MALATVDADGLPNVRMVLLKGFDERGFVFYTNLGSVKGHELDAAPKAALTFYWKTLQRQVRARGAVEPVSAAEADAYFASRSRMAQIGAWASKQSAPLESRMAFEKAVALYTAKFAIGTVPRPPFWSGYRVMPRRNRILAGAALPPARPHRVPARRSGRALDKTRLYPTVIRTIAWNKPECSESATRIGINAHEQPAAPHAAPHRSEPRHRPRHGEAVFRRRLARHHLFAPSVPGKLSVGSRAGGSHPGRSLRSARTPRRRSPRSKRRLARRAACAGQQRRDLAQGAPAASGSARSRPRARTGITCSR